MDNRILYTFLSREYPSDDKKERIFNYKPTYKTAPKKDMFSKRKAKKLIDTDSYSTNKDRIPYFK